jgi:putative MATE family efflux protein
MGVLTLLVAALGIPLSGTVLRAMGADEAVIEVGTPYLQILTGGAFAMFLSVVFSSLLRGAGDAVTPLWIIGLANVVNIVLDPIFIFRGSIPSGVLARLGDTFLAGLGNYEFGLGLGVAGSAWATFIARCLAAGMMAWLFFVSGHEHFHLRLRDLKPHLRTIGHMFKIGIFGSGRMLMINLSALALMRIVAHFGTAAVAAYTIGLRLRGAVMMLGFGFGNAAATLVGQNIGAGREDRAARGTWITTGIYVLFTLVISLAFAGLARPLVRLFNADAQVLTHGVLLMRWLSLSLPFMALSMVLGRAMTGAGDTLWPMLVTAVTMLVLRIPMSWGLAEAMGSVTGVWIGLSLSNVVQGGMFVGVFQWGRWKLIGRRHVDEAVAREEIAAGS